MTKNIVYILITKFPESDEGVLKFRNFPENFTKNIFNDNKNLK